MLKKQLNQREGLTMKNMLLTILVLVAPLNLLCQGQSELRKQLEKGTELLEKQNEYSETMAASQAKDDSKISQSIDKHTAAVNAHAQITKEGFDALRTPSDLQRVAQFAFIADTSVYLAKSANEFYHWAFPTEEELLRREKTSQDLAFLKNRRFLYQCLAENPKSVKNEDGIPVKCEDSFKAFVAVVGSIEAEKLKESFKKL